jgi:hypothetical protein
MYFEKLKNFLVKISFILMALQIIHLFWLTCNVTLPMFNLNDLKFNEGSFLFVSIDYLEIPSLIITCTSYLFIIFRESHKPKNILYFSMLVLQFLHIFWITDEFIVNYLYDLPFYLLIFVVFIDYSELFILFDLGKRLLVRMS